MQCCYGLIKTDVKDLPILLKQYSLIHGCVDKPLSGVVVSLGLRTVSRNLTKLEKAKVLVIDAPCRFAGYSLQILDKDCPVTKESVLTALSAKTPSPSYTLPPDPTLRILHRVQKSSVMHLMLQARYSLNTSARNEFESAFISALTGKDNKLQSMKNATAQRLYRWINSEQGVTLKKALKFSQRRSITEAGAKFSVPTFDLHYAHTLIKKHSSC